MRNIRIGVVEDDPASCQLVLDYLNRYQQENDEQFTVSVFDDGARIVEKYTPVYDILLLDIEMSEMDGMAAARRIRERDDKVVIVFITAAPQYAISGYEVRALSYLLKPLPWFAFSQELKKSIDMVRRNGDDSMLIETSNGQMRLNLADILYLESIRHTIVIHTLEGKLSINGTLKDMVTKTEGMEGEPPASPPANPASAFGNITLVTCHLLYSRSTRRGTPSCVVGLRATVRRSTSRNPGRRRPSHA